FLTPFFLSLSALMSASPMPAPVPVPGYRVPVYSATSKTANRSNMFADGVLIEFASGTSNSGQFPTQPNVSKDCTTWRAISSTDTPHQVLLYMSLNQLSYED